MRMRNYFVLMALAAALTLPGLARADQFLADFRGFDYEDPNSTPNGGDLGFIRFGQAAVLRFSARPRALHDDSEARLFGAAAARACEVQLAAGAPRAAHRA